jgi:hypothetical protein
MVWGCKIVVGVASQKKLTDNSKYKIFFYFKPKKIFFSKSLTNNSTHRKLFKCGS